MQLKEQFFQLTQERFGRTPDQCDDRQLYEALLLLTRRMAQDRPAPEGERKLYYFSAEFLMGRSIFSNLLNLGILDDAEKSLASVGEDLKQFEEVEDAALGNGGLGRLAACYLESAASKNIALDGYGIRYRYGLFRQTFVDGFQHEEGDDWLKWGDPWSVRVGVTRCS